MNDEEKRVLKNALISYWDILSAAELCCAIPQRFNKISDWSKDRLAYEMKTVAELIQQM